MTFQPWLKAYELFNKRLTRFYPSFRRITHTAQKERDTNSLQSIRRFHGLCSMIALVASTITSFILVPLIIPNLGYLSVMNFVICIVVGAATGLVSLLVMYL